MSETTTTLADGQTLHEWVDTAGDKWACLAYDHGPLCGRCRRVDETETALLGLALDGLATIRDNPSTGRLELKLTEEGLRQAGHLIRQIGGSEATDV
jgi:hypothetical protein